MNDETSTPGTLGIEEPHPSTPNAYRWILSKSVADLIRWQKSFVSLALENNRLAEVCSETLTRILTGQPVSDRYLLGLAWAMAVPQLFANDTEGQE